MYVLKRSYKRKHRGGYPVPFRASNTVGFICGAGTENLLVRGKERLIFHLFRDRITLYEHVFPGYLCPVGRGTPADLLYAIHFISASGNELRFYVETGHMERGIKYVQSSKSCEKMHPKSHAKKGSGKKQFQKGTAGKAHKICDE
ncbi:MAG: hypothetical protein KBS74_02945 [Clostridiales bacterium]|nr:hypothetical protein [Candidatus Cacconaster stercorequi]